MNTLQQVYEMMEDELSRKIFMKHLKVVKNDSKISTCFSDLSLS